MSIMDCVQKDLPGWCFPLQWVALITMAIVGLRLFKFLLVGHTVVDGMEKRANSDESVLAFTGGSTEEIMEYYRQLIEEKDEREARMRALDNEADIMAEIDTELTSQKARAVRDLTKQKASADTEPVPAVNLRDYEKETREAAYQLALKGDKERTDETAHRPARSHLEGSPDGGEVFPISRQPHDSRVLAQGIVKLASNTALIARSCSGWLECQQVGQHTGQLEDCLLMVRNN